MSLVVSLLNLPLTHGGYASHLLGNIAVDGFEKKWFFECRLSISTEKGFVIA
jgi:hypothetical protein